VFIAAALAVALYLVTRDDAGGAASQASAAWQEQKLRVKAMKPIVRDIALIDEYAAQVQARSVVAIQPRVSGNVVQKMISGGQRVKKGTPLFRIDDRAYGSALLSAQAQLAQAEVMLVNSARDTQRYERLLAADAISEQQVTTQLATQRSNEAVVSARKALVKQARDDMDDTLVVSPIDGRLSLDDVSVGTFAAAGNTVLVTVGSTNPMFVRFSISETEYLDKLGQESGSSAIGGNLTIVLSDGTVYPSKATVTEIDRGLSNNSGTLTVKAKVANPDGALIPDMFVRVRSGGTEIPGAVLIPQRAVQQLLDKSFAVVVGSGDTAETRDLVLGRKIGSFWVAESGISPDDMVVAEGLTRIRSGVPLDVTIVTSDDLGLTLRQNMRGE
jgi:membrane fusion protein (multidrug efflux system)